MMNKVYTLKYQRNEYGKLIRKQYESGMLQERRCNMREWTVDKTGIVHSLTSVMKDYGYVLEVHND